MALWTLYTGGRVLAPGRLEAVDAAVATFAGRIAAIGPRAELKSQVPPLTPEIRLSGRLVLPGLVDGHVHLLAFGIRSASLRLDLRAASSRREALAQVRVYLAADTSDGWLWGGQWDANIWPEGRPTAADLDSVTGDRPAALTSKCGHAMWLNSAALRALGIGRETAEPRGGRIERDARGEPTGILCENAMDPVFAHRPTLSAADKRRCLLSGIRAAHAVGLTGVHNCEGPETFGPLHELKREGLLAFRVTHHIPEALVAEAADLALGGGFGGSHLRIGSVKVFGDGSLGAQSAAMLEPYAGTSDAGVATHSRSSLVEVGRAAAAAGLALAVHAIGDRAVREALDAFEELRDAGLHPTLPHRIEHAQHIHPEDIGRFAALGAIASCQPVHLVGDMAMVERYLPDRQERAYSYGSLLRAGGRLCLGSDAPVESIDPLRGIRAAVLRQDPAGNPCGGWRPSERLTVREAIEGYTMGAAAAAGRLSTEGALTPGYAADMTILSHDILEDPDALEVCAVDLTVIDGQVVFDRTGLAG